MDEWFTVFPFCLRLLSVFLLFGMPAVAGCSTECICTQFLTNCTGSQLQQVPAGIPFSTQQLILSDNNISILPPLALNYLGGLVYLDFRNNSLTEISHSSLLNLKILAYLDLSRNQLRRITHLSFKSLTSMVVLKASRNRELTFIDHRAFSTNEKLQEIDISGNGLTFIDASMLEALPHLRSVRMSGNPWTCNCNAQNLSNWMRKNRRIIPDAANVTCTFPDSLQGVLVMEAADKLYSLCQRKRQLRSREVLYFCLIGPGLFSASIVLNFTCSLLMAHFKRFKRKELKRYWKLRRAISFKYSRRPNVITQEHIAKANTNINVHLGTKHNG
ncbi:leucine-rich repeat-containing protein 52-like [Rhincodon typus]|uniref:leucine-rich repeat-containing protein 52-like n=1 Tax=Rhincodon typus TaxID=259920 RepID=UPI00202FC96F|nr:leucine-rich repeat-containing protein 52-like [Rhincodon typus]